MNREIREIRCDLLAELEKEYPTEITVIREMLAAMEEHCLDEAA
jgi:hypothetical protein